jgi:hypothetical protein
VPAKGSRTVKGRLTRIYEKLGRSLARRARPRLPTPIRYSKDRGFPGFLPGAGGPTVDGVPEFIAELYLSHADPCDPQISAERARKGAAALTKRGQPVRLLRTTYVPGDETCFLAYEAAAADLVGEAGRLAGLDFERVVLAVEAR